MLNTTYNDEEDFYTKARNYYATQDREVTTDTIDRIKSLVRSGVLSGELFPQPDYWHWRILKPAEIPANLSTKVYDDEIRWYGEK